MTFEPEILEEAHRFWFGELDGPEAKASDKADIWFKQDDETDQLIRDRFGSAIAAAADAELELAALSRPQQIGLVALLDQFPRNIHRGSGEAFAYDKSARQVADGLIALGLDRFFLQERSFLLMPLVHSEAIADQDRCVMLFAEQAVAAGETWVDRFRNGLDFATKHRDVIRRFGRFPHRNEALGRTSTDEEKVFMEERGRGY